MEFAYACSIHKSQGSEYPAVIIPLHTQHYRMLHKPVLYTGVTRGKELVVLVGSRKALDIAVRHAENPSASLACATGYQAKQALFGTIRM